MPLSVDLEATVDECCADVLRPWTPLNEFFDLEEPDGDGLDLAVESFAEAVSAVTGLTQPLRAVRIIGHDATPAQLAAFLRAPALAALEALMLPQCTVGPDGASIIAAQSLPRLRWLDLRQTAIDDAGASALAQSPLATRLEHLSVAGSFLTVVGLNALLESPLGKRVGALHVEEADQPESIIPTLMEKLYEASEDNGEKAAASFARLLAHPALTDESRAELKYQWDLVMSSG